MANEPATDEAPHQDLQAHVRDYSWFVWLLKISAIVSLVTALIVIMLIS